MNTKRKLWSIIFTLSSLFILSVGVKELINNLAAKHEANQLNQAKKNTEIAKSSLVEFYDNSYKLLRHISSGIASFSTNIQKTNYLNDSVNLADNFNQMALVSPGGKFIVGNTVNAEGEKVTNSKWLKNKTIKNWFGKKKKIFSNDFSKGQVGVYVSEFITLGDDNFGNFMITAVYNNKNQVNAYLVSFLDMATRIGTIEAQLSTDLTKLHIDKSASFEEFQNYSLNEFESSFNSSNNFFIYSSYEGFSEDTFSLLNTLFSTSSVLIILSFIPFFFSKKENIFKQRPNEIFYGPELPPKNLDQDESLVVLQDKIHFLENKNRDYCQHKDQMTSAFMELKGQIQKVSTAQLEIHKYFRELQNNFPDIIEYSSNYAKFFNKMNVECTNLELKFERDGTGIELKGLSSRFVQYLSAIEENHKELENLIHNYQDSNFSDLKKFNTLKLAQEKLISIQLPQLERKIQSFRKVFEVESNDQVKQTSFLKAV